MTTTYYNIEHNGNFVDQYTNMDLLLLRLEALAQANPNNRYNVVIEGPGNPVSQPTDTTPT
jgi:hypothetical protein